MAAVGAGERLPMVEPIEARFPGLRNSTFRVTSPPSRDYNCVAWAAGDTGHWWWPDADDDASFWPEAIPREETAEAFVAAFAKLGYAPSSGEQVEPGFEKIALFAKDNLPTHVARQLANGHWTSKLGMREDIEHDLHAIGGEAYGAVAVVLKRRATNQGAA